MSLLRPPLRGAAVIYQQVRLVVRFPPLFSVISDVLVRMQSHGCSSVGQEQGHLLGRQNKDGV